MYLEVFLYILKYNVFVMAKLNLLQSSLQCHMTFRIHSSAQETLLLLLSSSSSSSIIQLCCLILWSILKCPCQRLLLFSKTNYIIIWLTKYYWTKLLDGRVFFIYYIYFMFYILSKKKKKKKKNNKKKKIYIYIYISRNHILIHVPVAQW